MTLEECIAVAGGDYQEVLSRLMMPALIEKFLFRFPEDATMSNLEAALAAGDAPTAFREAHTLKGVCANLGLANLEHSSSELTEVLRNQTSLNGVDYAEKLDRVRQDYRVAVDAIEATRA